MSDHPFNPDRSSGQALTAAASPSTGSIKAESNAVRIYNNGAYPAYVVTYDSANEAAIASSAAEFAVPSKGVSILRKKQGDDRISCYAASNSALILQTGNVFYGE